MFISSSIASVVLKCLLYVYFTTKLSVGFPVCLVSLDCGFYVAACSIGRFYCIILVQISSSVRLRVLHLFYTRI